MTPSRYLGGLIDDQDSDKAGLSKKVEGWTHLVEVLSGVARRHPQTAYSVLQKSLQKEWYFVQCITLHIGEASRPVEETLDK